MGRDVSDILIEQITRLPGVESMQSSGAFNFSWLSSRFFWGDRAVQKLVWRVKLVADTGVGSATVIDVAWIEREDWAVPEALGLSLVEGKQLTVTVQTEMVREFRLDILPQPKDVRWLHDTFGNCIAVASFTGEAEELLFDTRIVLDHEPTHGPHFLLESHALTYPFAHGAEDAPDLSRLIERQYLDPDDLIDGWVRRFLRQGRPTEMGELPMTLTTAIKESFAYISRPERGTQDPTQRFLPRMLEEEAAGTNVVPRRPLSQTSRGTE